MVYIPHSYLTEISAISFSAFLLVLSVLIYGLHLARQAASHKECYIALQKIHEEELETRDRWTKYLEILQIYPNHSNFDYISFLFHKRIIAQEDVKLGGHKIPKSI